jgi:hypothetical protein
MDENINIIAKALDFVASYKKVKGKTPSPYKVLCHVRVIDWWDGEVEDRRLMAQVLNALREAGVWKASIASMLRSIDVICEQKAARALRAARRDAGVFYNNRNNVDNEEW